jgi:hypothetical protein
MWLGTKDSKENTGHSSPNISVGAIFSDTARVFPAVKQFPIGEFDAGHFIPAGSGRFSLLFDERNLNGECPYDNAFNGAHLLLYRRGLDARYGPGTADALEERYRDSHFTGKITKEWRPKEYEAKFIELQEKLATLATG